MNEKRFYYGIFDDGTEYIEDYKKGEYYFDLNDVEKLLNELFNENELLKEKNERLQKNMENLQEVVAELGATLLMNDFEIEINGENLSELIDDE